MKQPAKMIVVPHRPGRSWAIVAFATLVCAGVFGLGAYLSMWREGVNRAQLDATVAALSEQTEEAERLGRSLADARLSQTVDAGANEQLRGTIKEMGDKIASLQEEVRFYKRLMAPSDAQRGLRIEQLNLEQSGEPGQVTYNLLLTQIVDRHRWVQGKVSVEVIGDREGIKQVLPLTELSDARSYPFAFRFRYFQDFSGAMELPEGFEPHQVLVTARTGGNKGRRVQRTFEWNLQDG